MDGEQRGGGRAQQARQIDAQDVVSEAQRLPDMGLSDGLVFEKALSSPSLTSDRAGGVRRGTWPYATSDHSQRPHLILGQWSVLSETGFWVNVYVFSPLINSKKIS